VLITLLPNADEIHNVDRLCATASNGGAAAVALPVGDGDLPHAGTPREACDGIRRTVAEAGLRVGVAWLPFDPHVHFGAGDPSVFERAIERTAAALERASWLGAETLVVVPASVGPGDGGGAPRCSYEDALNGTHLALHELRFVTERCGVQLGLQVGVQGFLRSPVETRELVDEQHTSWIGACVELATGAGVSWPADWFRTLGHRVSCVSFGLCGDGGASWPSATAAALEALTALGYAGPVCCKDAVLARVLSHATPA
jgi:sugar phosphate isomerase/epimerase